MTDRRVFHEPDGPGYQVVSSVNWPGMDRVGLIAQPQRGRGWVELEPDDARQLAADLVDAADATDLVIQASGTTADISRYCLCGAAMHVKTRPPSGALFVERLFLEQHSGEGHGPATRQQAAAARRRADRGEATA